MAKLKLSIDTFMTTPSFDVSDDGKKKIAEALRDMLKKQAKDGVLVNKPSGENSRVMPKGKHDGKRLDLVESGNMWGEVIFAPLRLIFTAPYAGFVIPKYAAGLSPRYQELWAVKCLAIVKKHLVVKKGDS